MGLDSPWHLGMFPQVLTVLHRDYKRGGGVLESLS